MFNYRKFYQKSKPSDLFQKLGLHSLVTFFSGRVIRGGPRILFHLAACFVVLILIVKLAPHELFGGLYSSGSFFEWNESQPAEAFGGQTQPGVEDGLAEGANSTNVLGDGQDTEIGGLRVVVFGEADVASPSRLRTYRGTTRRPGWTELLCHELHCSSYLTFTQNSDVSSYAVVSHELHNAAVKVLLDGSAKDTKGGGKPGKDYSFYPKKFALDKTRLDLARQVQSFLSMSIPSKPPSETLWVFTLGAWDVWSLAGMPTSISKPLVGLLVTHIFKQIELLYESSLNKESIAFSGPPTGTNTTSGGNGGIAKGTFKILIPTLFDPSLTPGWSRARPKLPEVHSNAEQLRNAIDLTNEWNAQVQTKVKEWIKMPYPDPAKLKAKSLQPPPRDAVMYDMAEYLIGTISDQQLRHSAAIRDQTSLGTPSVGSNDVANPCVDTVFRDGRSRGVNPARTHRIRKPTDSAICTSPDEHLFYSAFELGTRAVATIARQASGMVVRNETVRATLATVAFARVGRV